MITDDGVGNNVLTLTTHMCASDSPVQGNVNDNRCPNPVGLLNFAFTKANDGPLFYVHVLDLKTATPKCAAFDGSSGLEVDVAGSIVTNVGVAGVSPDYPVKVSGKTITVGNVPVSVLNDNTVETVASFEIVGLVTGNTLTNLCITMLHLSNFTLFLYFLIKKAGDLSKRIQTFGFEIILKKMSF